MKEQYYKIIKINVENTPLTTVRKVNSINSSKAKQ